MAARPLFEEGLVDVLEWSIDATWGFGRERVPPWVDAVLDLYANAGCLYGHGVAYSALSGRWEHRHEKWLERLERELKRRRYLHVSEHFGFMSARGFLPSAPLPVPRSEGSLRVGRYAIERLADVVGAPVGLENLAATFGPKDIEDQSGFLADLVRPTGGFLILDLHNLHCQAINFGISLHALIDGYPLDRVREIHVAGGRDWRSSDDPTCVLHTDSHNESIPAAVIDAIPYALQRCPNLEIVIFERFFGTLGDDEKTETFRDDFKKVRAAALGAAAPAK